MQKTTKNGDLTEILKDEHGGKWVALDSHRTKVMDYADSFEELESRVGRKGVVYMKVLQGGVRYAF